jgi:ribose transport system permease protein
MTARFGMFSGLTHGEDRQARVRRFVARYTPQLVLVALILLFFALKPDMFNVHQLTVLLNTTAPIAVFALGGMWVLVGGGLDFSGSSVLVVCALILGGLVQAGVPGPLAIVAVLGLGLCFGLVNGTIVAVIGIPAFIGTLATYLGFLGVVAMVSPIVGGTVVVYDPMIATLGTGVFGPIPFTAVFAVAVAVAVWALARHTTFGLQTYAVGSNRAASTGRGVRMVRQDVMLYMFSGLITALTAVVLVARTQVVDPEIAGVGNLLDAYAATIIGGTSLFGGRGTVAGTVTGALIIGLLSTGLISLGVPQEWVQAIKGTTIIAAVVIDAFVRTLEGRRPVATATAPA